MTAFNNFCHPLELYAVSLACFVIENISPSHDQDYLLANALHLSVS